MATGIRHGYRLVTIPAELSFLGRGTPYPKVTGLEELIPNTDSHHRQQAQFVTFDQCLFGRSNPDRDNVLGPGARDTYLKFNSSETLNKYSISTDLQARVRRNLAEGL